MAHPMRRTSSWSSTPNAACTRSRTIAMTRPTSSAVAPPDGEALQPRRVDQLTCRPTVTTRRGIRIPKHRSAARFIERRARLAPLQIAPDVFAQLSCVHGDELQGGCHHDHPLETPRAVAPWDCLAGDVPNRPAGRNHLDRAHDLPEFLAMGPRVHHNAATDRSRDADQP